MRRNGGNREEGYVSLCTPVQESATNGKEADISPYIKGFDSDASPPSHLDAAPWNTDDEQYLDKVCCSAWFRVTHIDAKNGAFEVKIMLHWCLRTLDTKDKTRLRQRIPGVRMPALISTVEESRIWRDESKDTPDTLFWVGVTVITVGGYELYEMQDFPFDRQLINLETMHFVWKSDKDTDQYDEVMKIVWLHSHTNSMLPEWEPHPAIIMPDDVMKPRTGRGPSFANSFKVMIRLERKPRYYSWQVFFVSTLITVTTILALFLKDDENVGDRLGLNGGGLLTLIAFKYGVGEQLPTVPYMTFASKFMLAQIICLVLISFEDIIMYKVEIWTDGKFTDVIELFEEFISVVLITVWVMGLVWIFRFKERRKWEKIVAEQQSYPEHSNEEIVQSQAQR